jgi:hypothetical protein
LWDPPKEPLTGHAASAYLEMLNRENRHWRANYWFRCRQPSPVADSPQRIFLTAVHL